ncbi:MAG: ABC transporter substrate-binding protein [Betaproteobacteria bacterium]|nr:MAG: ABC transporter substrate-binding protein [Betaproteobacteria bacterium]
MVAFLKRVIVLASVFAAGCSPAPWNNPYPGRDDGTNTLYSSFTERPRHLDPVQSYAMNEFALIANIYQPPLQYHYLKRPYQLIPFAATAVPQPEFFDVQGRRLPQNARAQDIAYSDYVIRIRPGIRYQPHPALATDNQGRFVYHGLKRRDLAGIHAIGDFKERGTRELVAADYVHQIKRLAHPRLHSPIMQLMSEYIVGLKELAEQLAGENKELPRDGFLDLTKFDIAGVQVTDRYTYRVRVRGKYPQFLYWLAMPFFAPVPPEADRFYAQPGLAQKNITLDWFPIGTGPYMLTVNNPNRQMVLERNPNYEGELYPSEGEPGDAEEGLLRDAGKPLPFVDKVVYSLEKEQIPYWNKFLQGYYDTSGISSDTFDEAVQFSGQGDVTLSDEMRKRGIRLQTSVGTTVFYLGFNMLDPVVGGYSERARKLRIAISIAVDQEEFISIFRNGRGVPAHGPIPPGIFGYREGKDGINPYVYDWKDGSPRRKSIEAAQRLLAQAGYPNGRNAKTGEPLLLNLDAAGAGPDSKARFDWYVKQLDKIGVQLVVRATDWNRFQDKVRKGNTQLYYLGWGADYPDPENFLFLLHGKQSKVKTAGENASNYVNREFDSLFEQMKNMDNGPRRQAIIDRMVAVACRDAPWVWSFFPKNFSLQHAWVFNSKPNQMANNSLKYQRIDPAMREKLRREWNQPVLWPVAALFLLLALSILPAVFMFRRRERATARLDVLPEKA